MDVVASSPSDDQRNIFLARDAAHVLAEVSGVRYRIHTILRAEDAVQEVVG